MRVINLFAIAAAALVAGSGVGGSQDTPRLARRMSGGGYWGPHSSTRFVAHDKRDATKAKNRARHRRAMKRRGR